VDVLVSPNPAGLENPYITMLTEQLEKCGDQITYFSSKALLKRHDVVHVHWPEYLVRWRSLSLTVFDIVKVIVLLRFARMRGSALVWTGHNLEPHEMARPRLWALYCRLFVSQVDLLISTGPGATELLKARYSGLARVPVRVVAHGHYRGVYPAAGRARAQAQALRDRLGLDEKRPVLLAFGQIRSYKNVPAIVRAWQARPADAQLLVAGKPSTRALDAEIRRAAAGSTDVHLLFGFVADDEVSAILSLADVVLAPYLCRSALNSGAAILALSLGRPAVLTDTPAARDVRRLVGPQWIYLCDGSAEDAIRVAMEAVAQERPASPDLAALDWGEVGRRVSEAYTDAVVLHASRRRFAGRAAARPAASEAARDLPQSWVEQPDTAAVAGRKHEGATDEGAPVAVPRG
jgi:glycosyltransferase involved in cell wall biosynthesis